MNIIEEIEKLAELKLQYAKEELEIYGKEWDDNFLNVRDFSPSFDFDEQQGEINFNFYLGGYIALLEILEKFKQ